MRHLVLSTLVSILLPALAAAAAPPFWPSMRLEAHGSLASLSDDDLDATYGRLPGGELGASWAVGRYSRAVVSVGYAAATGDPYYDAPDFDAGDLARLRVVPLAFGVRFHSGGDGPVRLTAGLLLQAAWLEERVPTGETDGGLQTLDGDGLGLLFTGGPEWSLAGGRHVLSLELALGGPSGEVHGGTRRHDVDLRAFQLRFGYALALGSGEVQR